MYFTCAIDSNPIEGFKTIDEAKEAIKKYEEEDKADGNYSPDCYLILDEKENPVS
jgi:hypothetical protein